MKAQSIWVGHDYAHWRYRSRGVGYTPQIERVKALKVTKERVYGNQKESTFVEVEVLDWDGNRSLNAEGEPRTTRVRAYDIVDFWDDYWSEHGDRLLEHKEFQARMDREREERRLLAQQQREEREAQEALRRQQLQIKRNAILQGLHNKGLVFDNDMASAFHGSDVAVANDGTVTIKGAELLRWLEIENVVNQPV